MSFAAIRIPDFTLQAVLRADTGLLRQPVVLLENGGAKSRTVVAKMTPAAGHSGVERGMTAPQVLARCPRAIIRTRSLPMEDSASRMLFSCAGLFAPRVEATEPGLCTVDLDGVLPEHRKSRPREILRRLRQFGLNARIGIARTPALARLASRQADPVLEVVCEESFIRDLPLNAAAPPPRLHTRLNEWGIATLGAFRRLSRQSVGERLGKEGVELWDQIHGRDPRVLQPVSLPETFAESIEFETPLETLDPLLFYVRRFTDQLALRLETACRAAEKVVLELAREHAPPLRRDFPLPEPTTRAEVLFRMLRTHMESLKSDRRLTGLSLRVIPCRIQSQQRELFNAAIRDPHQFAETLARLTAVAGAGNAGSPRLNPTHRPDAFRIESLNTDQTGQRESHPPLRPGPALRRFRPPVPARVRLRDGRPGAIESHVLNAPVHSARGPWRLSGEWWRTDRWSREEWDIEAENGGLYRLVHEKNTWFLEGMYD